MRVVGLDVSRTFGEIAYLEEGQVRPGGRVTLQHEPLQRFAQGLRSSDEVVLEATGNTAAIVVPSGSSEAAVRDRLHLAETVNSPRLLKAALGRRGSGIERRLTGAALD